MMPSNGPPPPNGVGGPAPPLVSRWSEKEWKTKNSTWGPPTSSEEGCPTPPPTRGRDESPPTQRGGEEPPPSQRGRQGDGQKEEGSQTGRPQKWKRRSHTSRELRMLDPSENPPPKRIRRSTRDAETMENTCETTRESNMICPITCGCRNSLLDTREKTRVDSHIIRTTRKILQNELIASFGLTAAITNKDEISE